MVLYLTALLLFCIETDSVCPRECACDTDRIKYKWASAYCHGNGSADFPWDIQKNMTELYLEHYSLNILNSSHFEEHFFLVYIYYQNGDVQFTAKFESP